MPDYMDYRQGELIQKTFSQSCLPLYLFIFFFFFFFFFFFLLSFTS